MSDVFFETFFGKETESDLGRALRNDDEDYLDKYLKQFDTKKENELFFILDKITVKRDLDFDVSMVNYNKFIIESMLSRSFDCMAPIFLLNLIGEGLTNQQHYDFLVRTVPVGRKNYKDGSRKYLVRDVKDTIVKILLMHVYECREEVADTYLDVLKARNKVEEFVQQYRAYLDTDEAYAKSRQLLKHKDQQSEYDLLVDDILRI